MTRETKPGAKWSERLKVAVLTGTVGLAFFAASAHACELQIIWRAALTPILTNSKPSLLAVSSPAPTGTAAIDFDFAHPGATVEVDTQNVQDVQTIELHVSRSYTNHTGPAVLTLYTAADGPLPAKLTKRVTEADLHKQTLPKIAAFSDVVNAVLNGLAYVTVATKAHPEGELSGVIRMHKEQIYSDNPNDPTHDSALHHAHLTATVNGTVSH